MAIFHGTTATASRRLFFMACLALFLGSGMAILPLGAQDILPPDSIVFQEAAESAIPPDEAIAIEPAPAAPAFPDLPLAQDGLGAEAWYFEAKKLEKAGKTDPESRQSVEFMYSLAFHFGEKAAAKEAGRALLQRSASLPDPAATKTLASLWLEYFGPDWEVYKTLIATCLDAGDYPCAIRTIAALRSALPSTAKTRANELAWYEYSALAALGDYSWLKPALTYLKAYSLDTWSARILRLAASAPGIDAETGELGLMRAEFLEKNYSQAVARAWGASRLLHGPDTARFLISEAGKSFLNAGMKEEGIAFFLDYFPGLSDPEAIAAGASEERLWVAAYYLARLWLSADRGREAAILFLGLTDKPPSDGDADGALWYWLDITMKRIAAEDIATFDAPTAAGDAAVPEGETSSGARRSLEFGALVEASARWKNPAYFDDIVDSYNRALLKEKSWDDTLSLLILIGERVSPGMRTRLQYLGGRLIEEKLALRLTAEMPESDLAGSWFRRILDNPDAEEYYRTMSAWRLGLDPPYLRTMPELPRGGPEEAQAAARPEAAYAAAMETSAGKAGQTASGNGIQSALSLIRNYLSYDLDEMASSLAISYLGSLDKSVIAGLAFRLSAEGQHYAALRLARDAVNRGAGTLYPELYGLVYPKAWNEIVAMGAAIPSIPEALAYGIIRSESVFDPKAVSYAGAVGLSQLMPATAAETARGLKMSTYSLTDPADNVRIGLTYYSYMLARFGGKPMRAMFAYNAGPSRMMGWSKESGELPDDILLETLHLAQPRQYAKNIIQASLAYGKIHYGIAPRTLLDYLVNAAPLKTGLDTAGTQVGTPPVAIPGTPAETAPAEIAEPRAEEPETEAGRHGPTM